MIRVVIALAMVAGGPLGVAAQSLPPVAVGISVTRVLPVTEGLGNSVKFGPTLRLGTGEGFGGTVGFGWYRARWNEGGRSLGRVRIMPVMGGVSYGIRRDNKLVSLSFVAGPSFNWQQRPAAADRVVDVEFSLAMRPGGSFWLDLNDRVSVNTSANYLISRPRVRFSDTGETRRLRADAIHLSAGVAYRLF